MKTPTYRFLVIVIFIDRAVVKFSGQCFEKPYDYTNLEETKTTIDAFKNYVKYGRSNPEPKFRAGVREMTVAGLEAELIWDKDISKFEDYTSFLRYASTNGVIFLKPGVTINKVYDPTKTLW
jgi:Iap family predicted aminopeptidase